MLAEHDPAGAALSMRGGQASRPSLYALRDELAAMSVDLFDLLVERFHAQVAAGRWCPT